MNSEDALLFSKVVEAGSFSKAGKLLNMPKSTLSRRIAQLEERLEVRLLQRTTRSLHLTEIGRGYLKHCERIVEEIRDAEAYIHQMQSTPQGSLKVSLPVDFGVFFMSDILADFVTAYPEISLEAELNQRVVNLLTEEIDVAIRMRHLQDSSLIVRKVGRFELGLYAHPDFYANQNEPQCPAEVDPSDCIALSAGDTSWIFPVEGNKCSIKPQHRYKANNLFVVQKAVMKKVGISVLPKKMCEPHLGKDLIPLLEEHPLETAEVYAVYPSKKYISSKLNAFLDFLQENLLN